jgi:hypothetical protein
MPATGQVQYGKTTAYGSSTTPETSFNYSAHVQAISGLSAATLYHFRVTSTNAGDVTTSGDQTSPRRQLRRRPRRHPADTLADAGPPKADACTPALPVGGSSTAPGTSTSTRGNTDVTSSLQAFVDGSPNGSVICFAGGGSTRQRHPPADQPQHHARGHNATIFQSTRSTGRSC